jgi:hypothetical protein
LVDKLKIMKTHKLFNTIDISFLNPYPGIIELDTVIEEIENKVPPFLFQEVDIIYVGNLDFLSDESVSSKYMDNAIYLTNMASYESDIVCDIIFALGEFLEKKYMHLIYENTKVVQELSDTPTMQDTKESFIENFYEYMIEDPEIVKDRCPTLCYVIEEMIKNESC